MADEGRGDIVPECKQVEVNRQVALLRKGVAKAGGSAEVMVDWATSLRTTVAKGRLRAELAEAFAFLQPKLPMAPLGITCPVRPLGVLQEASKIAGTRVVHTGGTLGMLKLDACAYEHPQLSRIEFILKEHWNGAPESLTRMLGTIMINADMWGQEKMEGLIRAGSDAEPRPYITETVLRPEEQSQHCSPSVCVCVY